VIFRSEIVFVKIILPLIIGLVLGFYYPHEQLLRVVKIVLPLLFIINLLINFFYKRIKGWQYQKNIALLNYLLFFVTGLFLSLNHRDTLQSDYFAKRDFTQIRAIIDNEPQQTNDILRFEVKVKNGYLNQKRFIATGKLLIALKVDSIYPIQLKYGDELLMSVDYQPVEPPYNPNEFDFKAWLASKNIYHQTFIRQEQLVKLAEDKGNPIIAYALEVRQKQVATYRKLIKDDEAFAVASTLILGYRADLSNETLAAYSKTGTIHALSVSGMHVGIIYLFLNWFLSFLNRHKFGILLKLVLIISLIWYYSLLTGFSPSVLRSAIMLSVFVFAKSLKRSTNSYNIICFTAFCLLVYNPFLLWDVGFQLSFLAVFGLIYLQPKIYRKLYFKNIIADKTWVAIAMSLAAQIATLPLSIYYFHQFPVYFIISNLFILLPISALMYGGLIILILKLHFLAPAFEWLITFTNEVLKWIADLPYAGITEIWIDFYQLILLSFALVLLCLALANKNKKSLIYSLLIFLTFQISVGYNALAEVKQKEVVWFSLRKNYAALFIRGNKAVLLTDLSADDKNFQFFVKPAIDEKGVKNLTKIDLQKDFQNDFFMKLGPQIMYLNKKFLLLDDRFNNKKIVQKLKFDYVWLHNNPKIKLEYIVNDIDFKEIIIDASNKDYVISKFKQQAEHSNLTSHILKKRRAFILKLNKP
jgi:competence protein ComEC